MKIIASIITSFILFSSSEVFSGGRTSVITLEFPHGAENCGMGEVGVSLAENINSVFWNPAALPAIGQILSLQYLYSHSFEVFLPSFKIKDLWHSDTVRAVFFEDIYKSIDFGASYSINFINMGDNESSNTHTLISASSESSS